MVGNTTVGYVLIIVIVGIVCADFLTPLEADAGQLTVIASLVGLLLGGRYLQQGQNNAPPADAPTDDAPTNRTDGEKK